jgi:hypothetical protein
MALAYNRSKIPFARYLVAGLLVSGLGATAACDESSLPGECPHNFSGLVDSNFGAPELDALLEVSAKLNVSSLAIENNVNAACNAIAGDLGAETSEDTAVACSNAATAIDGVLAAEATATLSVQFVPAVCNASVDAMVQCTAECDVNFDATATPPTCEGGELSGGCEGSCEGSCTVEASAACSGTCDASCSGTCTGAVSGTCTGTCTGQCSGTCSATDAAGNCVGECTGTCSGECSGTIEGSCSGSCEGSCSGSCRADISGECSGTCSGTCDVTFDAPTCEGGTLDVDASADCQSACKSDVALDVVCSEPDVIVSFEGALSTDLEALATTLTNNYGTIVAATAQTAIVVSAAAELPGRLSAAAGAAADVGLEAADCLRLAATAQVAAAARINVSVQASVEVSGSVSAGTN